MPGPIQSGISNMLGTATAIVAGAKHLKEEQAQTAEQKATKEEVAKNTALQQQLAEEADKKEEAEYKASITAGVKAEEQAIYDEETKKAAEKIIEVGRKHPNMSDLEKEQFKVYQQSMAQKAGDIAMIRIQQLTASDPYRRIQLAYANGDIANRHEYQEKVMQENLRKPTTNEAINQGLHKYFAEASPDKRR